MEEPICSSREKSLEDIDAILGMGISNRTKLKVIAVTLDHYHPEIAERVEAALMKTLVEIRETL